MTFMFWKWSCHELSIKSLLAEVDPATEVYISSVLEAFNGKSIFAHLVHTLFFQTFSYEFRNFFTGFLPHSEFVVENVVCNRTVDDS